MEGKGLKRKPLKWKILKNISLILAVSMIVSTMEGFFYFENVVRTQRISDERSILLQLSSQLTAVTEDMEQFSRSLLIDEEMHRLLEENDQGNEFHRQRRANKVGNRLSFYGNLRPYIRGIILQIEDGTCYGNSYNMLDKEYIEKKLNQEAIAKYGKSSSGYSDPYYDKESFGEIPMICYWVPMYDEYHFKEKKGTLYLEIDFDYFLDLVRSYMKEEEYICLLGEDGTILYEQGPDKKLIHCLEEKSKKLQEIQKTTKGYLLYETIGHSKWQLYTLVTSEYLWKHSRFVFLFFLFSFLSSISLILIFISKRMEKVTAPITELSEKMAKTKYGKVEEIQIVHTGDEIETLYECFQTMMKQLQEGEEERLCFEQQKKEMEYDIMMSQINPHYLYNVLNTVVYLASAQKNQDVVKIVHALIHTLHDTLKIGDGSVETTVEKELAFTQCYLDIQKYRYPEQFDVKIACEDELMKCKVPKTVIQPLVENAILHGILPTEQYGTIWIRVFKEGEDLCIQIEDDGAGISEKEMERFLTGEEIVQKKGGRKHIGISNVRDRIHYLYGINYGMEVKRKEKGTQIRLCLPFKFASEEEEEIW